MTAGDYAALIVAAAGYTGTLTVGLKPKPAPKVIAPETGGTS